VGASRFRVKHHFYQLWSKNFQEENWLFAFLYMEAKFGRLEKRIRKTDITGGEFFSEEQLRKTLLTTRGTKKFWKSSKCNRLRRN